MPEPTLQNVAEAHAAGRIGEARALCERVLVRAPADGDALMWSGLIAMSELRWNEAIAAFEQALAIRPDPASLANLGACYSKLGRLDDAHRSLRRATELMPGLYKVRIALATVLHGLGRYDDALAELEAAQGGEHDYQVDLRRGCTLAAAYRFDEAQVAFERAAAASPGFVYARLVRFDRRTFEALARAPDALAAPALELDEGDEAGTAGVVLVSCDPSYARTFGVPFLRSYAAHAARAYRLHLHIPDPDASIVAEMAAVAREAGLARITITSEAAPLPSGESQQRRAYYACARLLHLPRWLAQYDLPMLLLDADFIVESALQEIFEAAADVDVALNLRHPTDSPWLDVIANVLVAKPTPRAYAYFSAVARYALEHIRREPQAWLVDQSALYCVLRMFERFGDPPRVRWLPEAHKAGLWHIGHMYQHLLNEPRYTRWAKRG